MWGREPGDLPAGGRETESELRARCRLAESRAYALLGTETQKQTKKQRNESVIEIITNRTKIWGEEKRYRLALKIAFSKRQYHCGDSAEPAGLQSRVS